MKLFRFGPAGHELPGIVDEDGRHLGVSAFGSDFDEQFFATKGLQRLRAWLELYIDSCPIVPEGTRFGSPVKRPSKIICIGLNYAAHAKESGAEPPKEPIIFFKATTSLCGPHDNLILPRGSSKTDWEVELAVIIGRKATYVSEEDAMDHVAGYAVHNDYSERSFQLERGGQWVKGKSADTFAPLGPYLVTADEIADPHQLNLWLKVNDKMMQNGNTSDFIFNIPFLISYLSQFMTLLPGDIISTGTPSGVGLGMSPPTFLKAGDVVELGIEGLGSSKQVVKAYAGRQKPANQR